MRLVPAFLLITGLALTFQPIFQHGPTVLLGTPIDMRLIGYLLEHGYRWIAGDPLHASFWNAPFFFPVPNVTALSETFLGSAPLYWISRAIGLDPDVSFTLWLIELFALNFLVFLFFLRRATRLPWLPSSAGAYLFAFAGIRLQQIGHAQMLPHFYTVLALHGLWMALRSAAPSPRLGFALFTLATAAQLYAGFYLGWFWLLALTVALAIALCVRACRERLAITVRALMTWPAAAVGAVSVAMLAPLAAHALDAAREVGMRDFSEVVALLPQWRSWLNFGPNHLLFGWWYPTLVAGRLPLEWEHRLGLGLFTVVAVVIGAWRTRREPWAPVLFGTALVLLVLSTQVRGFTLWQYVYALFPAAGSIRAVSRIAVVVLIPASIAFAFFVNGLFNARRWGLVVCALLLLVVEHHAVVPAFSRTSIIAREIAIHDRIGASCEAFLYTPSLACRPDEAWGTKHQRAVDAHLDAMWVSLRSGIATLNGYSGSLPRGYPFWGLDYCGPSDDATIQATIDAWCAENGCEPASVCWIR